MKLKYFILPAALVLVGFGCEQSKPVVTVQPQIVEKIVEKPCPPQPVLESFLYHDPKYGFILGLPAEWKFYSAKYRQIDWGIFKTDSLDIGLPGDDSLLNIAVMTDAQWKKLQADPDITEKGVSLWEIKDGENYIPGMKFIGQSAQSAQPQNMQRFKEVSGILNSFRFEISKTD